MLSNRIQSHFTGLSDFIFLPVAAFCTSRTHFDAVTSNQQHLFDKGCFDIVMPHKKPPAHQISQTGLLRTMSPQPQQ
jgi:hypothetical protein